MKGNKTLINLLLFLVQLQKKRSNLIYFINSITTIQIICEDVVISMVSLCLTETQADFLLKLTMNLWNKWGHDNNYQLTPTRRNKKNKFRKPDQVVLSPVDLRSGSNTNTTIGSVRVDHDCGK